MAKKKSVQRGFTLIELVIVIAVIAILAALLVPTILGQAEKARFTRASGEQKMIGETLARIRTQTGNTSAACLGDLRNLACTTSAAAYAAGTPCVAGCGVLPLCSAAGQSADTLCWAGPFFNVTPVDPWGQGYVVNVAASGVVTVSSSGPDRTANNADDVPAKTY